MKSVFGNLTITINPRLLAHCRMCRDPMYCIYDWRLRDYCWQGMQGMYAEDEHDGSG